MSCGCQKRFPWGALWGVIVLVLLLCPAANGAGPSVALETTVHPLGVRVEVVSNEGPGWGLLEVLDDQTGACLKTVYAGRFARGQVFTVAADSVTQPGRYRLRYRVGIDLVLAGKLDRPEHKLTPWLSPTELVLTEKWIYVLDSGTAPQPDKKESPEERLPRQPTIFKLDRNGRLDSTFGNNGRLTFPDSYDRLRAFAVDPVDGRLFVADMGHELQVFDANGKPTKQTVGGWDGHPGGPRGTVWCNSVALGFKNRIYIPNHDYGNGKVFDRNKNALDGILYAFTLQYYQSLDRYICSDMMGSVYIAGRSQLIAKFTDDEKSLKLSYVSDPAWKLAYPTGGSASGGLVWWACHGPGFGPFWDSGGGGEVVLIWDTGNELQLLARYGSPGVAADRLEFLNPSTAIMNPQHTELWVAEDGLPNKEGPPGNARVRRFELRARHSEEVELVIPK